LGGVGARRRRGRARRALRRLRPLRLRDLLSARRNSSADDSGGAVSGDQLGIYFTSERAGGAGGRDLWFADRAAAGAAFSTPQNLVEINGASDEADPAISADGRELFFATTRAGSAQIWHAWRTCLSP
jgi:Tol biopolymer transport system component